MRLVLSLSLYNLKLWFHCPNIYSRTSKLRALISNNFGRRKNDPAKDRKALATYVELKGYGQGRPEKGANLACFSLDEIAKGLNMSKRNLQRALWIERNLTDSMKELLDISNKIKYRSPRNKTTKHALKRVLVVFCMPIPIFTIKYKQIFWTYIRLWYWQLRIDVLY